MQIDTTRFGRIEVAEEAVIHFPQGLYGLEGTRHYCLLPHDDLGRFHWLQSIDEPHVAMVLTDPFDHFPTYEVEISDPAAALLGATTAADVAIYAPITVARDSGRVHANLLGPLVVNPQTRVGLQLVQDGARYSTRHLLGNAASADEAA